MVGTPPNIIANGALQAAGMKEQFGSLNMLGLVFL